MDTLYNTDEQISNGIFALLKARLCTQIDINNLLIEDGITMSHVLDENIYNDWISAEEIMAHKNRLPAICFYQEIGDGSDFDRVVTKDIEVFKLALFTDGEDGATLLKRYIATVREVIEVYNNEIYKCVFRAKAPIRRYYTPFKFGSSKLRVGELTIRSITEVRK